MQSGYRLQTKQKIKTRLDISGFTLKLAETCGYNRKTHIEDLIMTAW